MVVNTCVSHFIVPPAQVSRLVGINGLINISSRDFPVSCCVPVTISVRAASGNLRLVFTDLDLPKGSALHVSIYSVSFS